MKRLIQFHYENQSKRPREDKWKKNVLAQSGVDPETWLWREGLSHNL